MKRKYDIIAGLAALWGAFLVWLGWVLSQGESDD